MAWLGCSLFGGLGEGRGEVGCWSCCAEGELGLSDCFVRMFVTVRWTMLHSLSTGDAEDVDMIAHYHSNLLHLLNAMFFYSCQFCKVHSIRSHHLWQKELFPVHACTRPLTLLGLLST